MRSARTADAGDDARTSGKRDGTMELVASN
jgi:hypothetical protein